MSDKSTIDYYNMHAEAFVSGTRDASMNTIQDKFLSLIPAGGRILDMGCGSGRDTKYFLGKGYETEALDASQAMCDTASEYAGIQVRCAEFADLDNVSRYDGIWACSSLLHAEKEDLPGIFMKVGRALKENGVFYCSFKYGDFAGYRHERYFTDLTEESLAEILDKIPALAMEEEWISSDVRPGRENEKWLNALMRKKAV